MTRNSPQKGSDLAGDRGDGDSRSHRLLSNSVCKPFFEALLALFAREAGAGRERSIVLQLDNAGWHGEAGLAVPDGIRLV